MDNTTEIMKKIAILLTLLLIAGIRVFSQTQGDVANQAVAINMSNVLSISSISSSVSIPFTTMDHYANGIVSSTQDFIIKANKKYNITVKTSSNYFSYIGNTADPNMPVNNILKVKVVTNNTDGNVMNSFSSFQNISTVEKDLIKNGRRGSDNQFSIQYSAAPGFAYPAGTYTVDVIYTATQN
jgi:hypothetical protein